MTIRSGATKTYTIDKITPKAISRSENALFRCGALETAAPPTKIGALASSDAGEGSVVRAKCSSSGVDVFRVGRSIYAKNASDVVSRLASNFFYANTNTVMFHDDGAFIMTDGSRLLRVTDALATGTAQPYVPIILKFESATSMAGVDYEKPNVLSDNIGFEYSLSEETSLIYFPRNIKYASLVSVKYKNGTSYSGTCRLVTSVGTTTLSFNPAISGNFIVTLKLGTSTETGVMSLNSFSNVRNVLYSATSISVLAPFISGTGKTLMLSSGDTLFAIEVRDGLYVTPDAMISSSVGDQVTAMVNYTSGVLVFTPSCVIYAQIEGSGTSDPVIVQNIIKRDVGCDMPMSVVGCDNKIFFANSESGIYYIDKFGLTERDGSCHVSTIIDGELLSNTKSALQGAVAFANGKSYYLSVGGTVYIWNYVEKHPPTPDVSDEKKLEYVFARITTVDTGDFIGKRGDKIYLVEKTTGYVYSFDEDASPDQTASSETEIETCPLDLGSVHEKVMTRLVISAIVAQSATVKIYYDGAEAKSSYTMNAPSYDGVCSFVIRPERHKFRNVKLKITSDNPICLRGVEATFSKTGV